MTLAKNVKSCLGLYFVRREVEVDLYKQLA